MSNLSKRMALVLMTVAVAVAACGCGKAKKTDDTEPINAGTSEYTAEASTTEEQNSEQEPELDAQTKTYRAYYDLVKTYMENYPAVINYSYSE